MRPLGLEELPRLIGRALAAPYGRWCLRRVCRDAKTALEDRGKGLDAAGRL